MKRRRPTLPTLLKLIVFLLLGAIINVAVAWGCALADDRTWKKLDYYGWPRAFLRVGKEELVVQTPGFIVQRAKRPSGGVLLVGFAINTMFYAAILWGVWMMFTAHFALRRRRRIKRGLCPACAYPTCGGGESNICTECGTPKPVKP